MNPKPFSSLNHLTVPVGMSSLPPCPLPLLDGGQTSSPRLRNVRLAPLEARLARAVLEKGLHGPLEVLRAKERRPDLRHAGIGAAHALVEEGPHHALGGGVGPGRTLGQPVGEAKRLLVELVVGE